MSDTESFEHAMAEMRKVVMDDCYMTRCSMYDDDCYQCQQDILDRLQRAHERELEHVSKAEFARGYHDGQHSMDAEHYAVALRLNHLPLDEDSHGNLSQIARAVWHADFGWTQDACRALRDELVRLMGGVHKPDEALPTYDVLGNERHKAVCELREIQTDAGGFVKALANALGVEWQAPRVHQTIAEVRDRLIHLLGSDTEPNSQKLPILVTSVGEDGGEVTITDELRKFKGHINAGLTPEMVLALRAQINCIADRIDEQEHKLRKQRNGFKRAMCAAQDLLEKRTDERDELQRKLDSMTQEYIAMRSALEISSSAMKGVIVERDELQAKLNAIREAVDAV